VLILVILATLVTSAASGAIDGMRARSTLATMRALELAISQFAQDAPLLGGAGGQYKHRYGAFPPDDFVYSSDPAYLEDYQDVNLNGQWDWGEPVINDRNENLKYDVALLDQDLGGVGIERLVGETWQLTDSAGGYSTIETLCLCLARLSPRAEAALKKLPSGRVANQDTDLVVIDTNNSGMPDQGDERTDLFEVTDSWDRPLRYEVRPMGIGGFRWELRSAGPDKSFADMWTPEDDSDDVILNGP